MARPLLLKIPSPQGLHLPPLKKNTKPKHLISLQTFSRYTEVICKQQQGNTITPMPVVKLQRALDFALPITLLLELLFC